MSIYYEELKSTHNLFRMDLRQKHDVSYSQEKLVDSSSSSPKSSDKAFLTLNESRAIGDDARTSAFSPYQKSGMLEPFNGEQEFLDDAQRYFSSFFASPGHPEDVLLSALPPIPTFIPATVAPPTLTKSELAEMRREHVMPLTGPPTQTECYCNCCVQWRLYFNPPASELNARPVPKLCYCVCCRKWDLYLHFTYNTQMFGYYDSQMYSISHNDKKNSASQKNSEIKSKRKTMRTGPRKPRAKAENKENATSTKKRKTPTKFSQKSLMKKDSTLKLNTSFQPKIPYLTPLDSDS